MYEVQDELTRQLDIAFSRFWYQSKEQLQAFIQNFLNNYNIQDPGTIQRVQEYADNRYPYWKLPVIIPKPASPTITTGVIDVPQQKLPEREPGTFWETPMGTWAQRNWWKIGLGAIVFWYLLDIGKDKKKRPFELGAAPSLHTPMRKTRGNRLYYLWKSPLVKRIHLAKRKDLPGLKQAAEYKKIELYAVYAKNVDEARDKVISGEAESYPLEVKKMSKGIGKCEGIDEFGRCEGLSGADCVDTRPPRKSPISKVHPVLVSKRRKLLEKCGRRAFLLPEGTPSRPTVPSYPVMGSDCCYHCGLMRMQYTRLGAAYNRAKSRLYKGKITEARERLIRKAAQFADRRDPSNACNWALKAAEKYKIKCYKR